MKCSCFMVLIRQNQNESLPSIKKWASESRCAENVMFLTLMEMKMYPVKTVLGFSVHTSPAATRTKVASSVGRSVSLGKAQIVAAPAQELLEKAGYANIY